MRAASHRHPGSGRRPATAHLPAHRQTSAIKKWPERVGPATIAGALLATVLTTAAVAGAAWLTSLFLRRWLLEAMTVEQLRTE